jgi:plastocyanin
VLCAALLSTVLGSACHGRGEDGVAVADAGGTIAGGTATAGTAAGGSTADASAPAPSATQPASGRTIDVQMIGDATGYRFVPATVTIKSGDTVRWTNVSGGPHNVTFWSDSLPAGAAAWLNASMPQVMSPLTGPLLMTANATYAISFRAPAGTYEYYCMPHLALGMKAKIVVE